MKSNLLLLLAASLASAAHLHAQTFFTATPRYLTPSWRGTAGTEFSHWDVLYSSYGDPLTPGDGLNYPDFAAPNGTGDFASATPGAIVPANASPGDPFAFWHTANPTLRQTGTSSGFIVGPGTAGNLYSFAAATRYEIADATPFTAGTVVLQWQADGQLLDFSTLKLVAGGNEYAPTNFVTEYKSSGSSFGGVTNRAAAQWDLTGLGITGYTLKIDANGSSNSFQEARLDTAPTYVEAVPSARARSAASGLWSESASWAPALAPSIGGNIAITNGSALTIDGGVREIGELQLSATGSYTFGASGGGVLKINSGITATPSSATTYAFNTPVQFGSYNLTMLNAQTTVAFQGGVSGSAGMFVGGAGRVIFEGANTFTGPLSVDADATVLVHGSLSGSGAVTLLGGTLGGTGTINRPLTLDGGDTLAPGASVGTLTTGAQTWAAGGRLALELQNPNGVAGTGWDLVNINGALSITADSAGRFTLALSTLTTGGVPGALGGFDSANPYVWKFAASSGAGAAINSFAPTDFLIAASGFQNALGGGSFSVTRTGNDLALQFTPVPEPQTGVLAILGLAAFAVWRNRTVIAGHDVRD